jgi:hypothetical protein
LVKYLVRVNMFSLLLFMHYIALCTSSIALFSCVHLSHMQVDHAEQKSEIQAERVQKKYDGPQVPSCMDTKLAIGSRQALVQHTTILDFYF